MSTQTVTVRLRRSIPGLGSEGDVLRVAFGYARNFLLARGLAVVVSSRNADAIMAQQQSAKAGVARERQAVIDIAASLNGRAVEMKASMNADGRLFAGIQADTVAAALETDPIFRMAPIKQAGEHQVSLDFGHDIVANVTIVVRPDAPARR